MQHGSPHLGKMAAACHHWTVYGPADGRVLPLHGTLDQSTVSWILRSWKFDRCTLLYAVMVRTTKRITVFGPADHGRRPSPQQSRRAIRNGSPRANWHPYTIPGHPRRKLDHLYRPDNELYLP